MAAYMVDRRPVERAVAAVRWARTQVTGLRERLLTLGVHVVVSVRRIVLHLPTSTPGATSRSRAARARANPPGVRRTLAPSVARGSPHKRS